MRALKWLDEHIEEVLLALFFTIMVVFVFLQVILRYVFESSITWSEEISRYCFIWLIYIGVSYGVKKQRHISIDILPSLLNERGQVIIRMIANLFFLGFAVFVVVYGTEIVKQILAYGQLSPALHIPMGFVYLASPVGMGLTVIRILQQMIMQGKMLMGTKQTEANLD